MASMNDPSQNGFPCIFVPVMQQAPIGLELEMQPMQSFYMVDPMVYYGQATVVEPFQVVEDPTLSESDIEDSDFLIPKRTPTTQSAPPTSTHTCCQYFGAAILLSIIAAYISILVVLPYIPGNWDDWKQATCLPNNCFCEEPRPNLLRQPTNTWTNIAFSIYGVYILLNVWVFKDRKYSGVETFYAVIYAFALIFIGIMSGWYHASLTFLGQWFDNMGMFLLVNWCFNYNFARLKIWGNWGFIISYILLNAAAGYASYAFPATRRYVFGGMIIIYLLSTFIANRKLKPVIQNKYIWYAILCFAVAFGFWVLDLKHIVCWPTAVFQGHGVWHILTATSAYLVYVYYTTEQHPQYSPYSDYV